MQQLKPAPLTTQKHLQGAAHPERICQNLRVLGVLLDVSSHIQSLVLPLTLDVLQWR